MQLGSLSALVPSRSAASHAGESAIGWGMLGTARSTAKIATACLWEHRPSATLAHGAQKTQALERPLWNRNRDSFIPSTPCAPVRLAGDVAAWTRKATNIGSETLYNTIGTLSTLADCRPTPSGSSVSRCAQAILTALALEPGACLAIRRSALEP